MSCFCKCKDTKLKAIHNLTLQALKQFAVVFANAKILNWKQFTTVKYTQKNFTRCFCKCKDTKLKAIHNSPAFVFLYEGVVFANAKILNWKQFTTILLWCIYKLSCFCKCKDTKLKAIHNDFLGLPTTHIVVFANAKILNWKQFTTLSKAVCVLICCFCKCKDTKLKAIHNFCLLYLKN